MGRGGIDTSASGRSHEVFKLNLDTSLDNFDLFHKSVLPYQISKVSPGIGCAPPSEEAGQEDWLSHSIEQVCRKTLYKNVQYRTINMSSEAGSEKDVCHVQKDKLAEKPKIDAPHSTPAKPAPPNNKATDLKTPENVKVLVPKTPKTSTPKSASSFMKRCRRGSSFRLLRSSEKKNVRFASTEDLAAEERDSPNGSLVPPSETRVKAEEALKSIYATVSPIVPTDLRDVCRRLPFADEDAMMSPVKKTETPECSFLNSAVFPENSPLGHYLQWIIEQSGLSSVPSVQQWLKAVRLSVENECLSSLQSKSLTKDPALAAVLAVGDAHDAITSLQDRVDSVMATVTHVARRLQQGLWLKFCSSTPGLSSEVNDLLRDYKTVIHGSSPYSRKVESHLHRLLQNLREIGARPNCKPVDLENIVSLMTDIKNTVQTLCNSLILKDLEKIVKMSRENRAPSCARRSVAALSSLGEAGPDMCDLITRVGGISALLSIAEDAGLRPLKCATVRALTIICGHSVAIRQLEQAGGIECIERTLRDADASQQEKCEAVGLLAQITAPWVDCTGGTLRHMSRHMDSLVSSLTGIIEQANSGDVFLLSAAALANLSFLDRVALECIHRNKSVRALMLATRQKDLACSIFAKDQVATILANASAGKYCHADIIESGALIQLVCYLQVRPSSLHSSGEVDACERVLQKSAIALARLCSCSSTAGMVLQMQGVQRLVRLCKEPKERNSSNSVLVACLAALRKIAASSGHKDLKDLGAADLVKDDLWNSFKQYSVAHESYV
ncbi:spindle orientation adaptor protein inscuteable isoform X1 [Dermacentor variabilis]|uniref:spindle orientation adaptor protein inscuteable isoform X1 n=1 Tax=Dermacentor variabilis TaxID=34621 RepID=UPI003F5B3AC1